MGADMMWDRQYYDKKDIERYRKALAEIKKTIEIGRELPDMYTSREEIENVILETVRKALNWTER